MIDQCNDTVAIDSMLLDLILVNLDTRTSLISKKSVSKEWANTCTMVITNKVQVPKQLFKTNSELYDAVQKYTNNWSTVEDIEKIVMTYRWSIGVWDVSK